MTLIETEEKEAVSGAGVVQTEWTQALISIEKETGVDLGDYQYLIVSDGSGHDDGDKVGAACTYTVPLLRGAIPEGEGPHMTLLAQSDTTTTRQELQGLLNGLPWILRHPLCYDGAAVLWLCDNQSVVGVVDGSSTVHRNQDLWVLYQFYVRTLKVHARHIPRDNRFMLHNLCDLHASTARVMLVDYLNASTSSYHAN